MLRTIHQFIACQCANDVKALASAPEPIILATGMVFYQLLLKYISQVPM